MFSFQWPWMVILLIVPLIVRYACAASVKNQERNIFRFSHVEILQQTFGSSSAVDRKGGLWFRLLIWGIWICLVCAIMRPQIVDQNTKIEVNGYDIMLAVDLSGSMRALDFATRDNMVNRLDVAKKVVSRFVDGRSHDRVGLTLFGDSAYQYAPLTTDMKSVSEMLRQSAISMAGDGTAIGDAIGLSVKALRDRPKSSRMIILLTDGEDTASSVPPEEAANLAAQYGIKIYTIGIGSNGLVPYQDQYGRISRVHMRYDIDLLKDIAETTGGNFYHASDTQTLDQIYQAISEQEKTIIDSQSFLIRTPLFRYPLGLGLLFLFVLACIPILTSALYVRKGQV
ncbi:MAG: vWA domain-containing protein [Alphaproteobacteria bacterium]